jgi:hypothetical protein
MDSNRPSCMSISTSTLATFLSSPTSDLESTLMNRPSEFPMASRDFHSKGVVADQVGEPRNGANKSNPVKDQNSHATRFNIRLPPSSVQSHSRIIVESSGDLNWKQSQPLARCEIWTYPSNGHQILHPLCQVCLQRCL